jgi:dTDP-4-dehydrorhamnose 3,5-epimerase-like enzyme
MSDGSASIARLISLQEHVDQRGQLVVTEVGKTLPFEAARMFVISGVPEGEPRGIHAHRQCHQFLICVSGSVKAMVDDGESRQVVVLDRPSLGLHMPPLTWGAQYNYSDDAVLVVLASHPYDADDYIHDYDEFVSAVNASGKADLS